MTKTFCAEKTMPSSDAGAQTFWAVAAKEEWQYLVQTLQMLLLKPLLQLHSSMWQLMLNIMTAWWENHLGRPPILPVYVMHVKHALQSHPETPHLREQHINCIIWDVGFLPIMHEPSCLYHGTYKGHHILFLWQVDNFTIAAQDTSILVEIFEVINLKMSIWVNLSVLLLSLTVLMFFRSTKVSRFMWKHILIKCYMLMEGMMKMLLNTCPYECQQ